MPIKIGSELKDIKKIVTKVNGELRPIKKVITLKNGIIKVLWSGEELSSEAYIIPIGTSAEILNEFISKNNNDIKLIFLEGEYEFSGIEISNKTGLIEFVGNNTIFKGTNIKPILFLNSVDKFEITDIYLKDNTTGIEIDNCNLDERGKYSGDLNTQRSRIYDKYIKIDNCKFEKLTTAINVQRAGLMILKKSYFSNLTYPYNDNQYGLNNHIIESNVFKNNTRGTQINNASNVIFNNNDVTNCYYEAVNINGKYIFISNNNIINSYDCGLIVSLKDNCVCKINGNMLLKNQKEGIKVTSTTSNGKILIGSNLVSFSSNVTTYPLIGVSVSGTKTLVYQNRGYRLEEGEFMKLTGTNISNFQNLYELVTV